ncbi:hypothetical protein SRABI106_04048 [Rahnella aquatilis]|nr:hypothetical protein SRABI106_04048 [Rahnella aquatilis]
MMAFIKHQQQIFRRRQHRFRFQRSHHQRVVSHHHIGTFNLFARHKIRAFAEIVAVTAEAVGFVGADFYPQRIVDGFLVMIAQSVPLVAGQRGFQRFTEFLFFAAGRRQFIAEEQPEVALRILVTHRRQITRADITATPECAGEFQIRNNFFQQREIFTKNLILQRHVGGADNQRFFFLAADGNAGDQIGQRFPDAGWRLNGQMPCRIPRERFRHLCNHLTLRSAGNEVRDLLLQGFVPLAYLIFYCGGKRHASLFCWK